MGIVAPRLALPVEGVLGGSGAKSGLATRFSPAGGDALMLPVFSQKLTIKSFEACPATREKRAVERELGVKGKRGKAARSSGLLKWVSRSGFSGTLSRIDISLRFPVNFNRCLMRAKAVGLIARSVRQSNGSAPSGKLPKAN
ncbi:hypothetical protein PSTT_16640 [Puccinia striiformis]|nr:hypothetical protein PSTT_16640 [Puccinia striiformis]